MVDAETNGGMPTKLFRRKLRRQSKIAPESDFPVLHGMHYLAYLEQLHQTLKPKVYLEIGTETGASLSLANCISIAIDPKFRLQADVSRNKPELHQYQGY